MTTHSDPTPSPALAAHVAAAARHADTALADGTLADAAQQRLLAALPAARPRPHRWLRPLATAATACAVLVLGVALFLGDQRQAFAAVQQHLRDFDTLRLVVEQRMAGEPMMRSTMLLDRHGSLRTDVGEEVSVIVDVPGRTVLTLLHGARQALSMPLPAGRGAPRDDALHWLDTIRDFQGEAAPLPQSREIDGVPLHGWRLETQGMTIDLWADDDGVPRAMELGGAQGLTLDYRFAFDVPIDPVLLSSAIPPGYTPATPDAD